ncbi:hypothetical protein [Brevibacillus laterosporus]|uniref:hypothetical protein n=1 Tax=Brevibacillus laterosporus TaxID=1465 RepID=UPI000556C8A4|nr:hypothetical protein [Brevibacillus laterosporus]
MNEENDQEVKKNVEEVFADVDMSSIESKPEKGIDYKKLEFVDKEMKKFETKRQLAKSSGKATCKGGSVDCAGAYDTYYNYDRTTGKFIVQALSANAHEYVKLKGSTLGSSKNASSLSKFQKQADEFESFIIDYMDYDFYEDTFEWFVALMGLAGLVLGYGTGPAGWVAICVFYAGAYSTFQTLTSKGYATLKRLNYSENAAKYNQNCRELLRYKNWEDVKTSLVDGY